MNGWRAIKASVFLLYHENVNVLLQKQNARKSFVGGVEDLGTLSQTLLKNFLKEVFKNFKNFNQGDFCPLLFVVQILSAAIFRAANSGCSYYRIEVVGKDLGTLSQTLQGAS